MRGGTGRFSGRYICRDSALFNNHTEIHVIIRPFRPVPAQEGRVLFHKNTTSRDERGCTFQLREKQHLDKLFSI